MFHQIKLFLTFLLILSIVRHSEQQNEYGRGFYPSLDDASHSTVQRAGDLIDAFLYDERLHQLDEKLTNYFNQQIAILKTRIEVLERTVNEMKHAIAQDWNATSEFGALYKIFTTKKSWDDAQTLCRLFGSQLAIIDTELKNENIKGLILSHNRNSTNEQKNETTDTPKSEDEELWIGLKTRAEMVGYGHPQYTNFYDEERIDGCTTIDASGKWKIRPCAGIRPFVCQQLNLP